MSINEKKFTKKSSKFTLTVDAKIHIEIHPSTYDEPLTLKEIVDFEVYGDGWKDNLRVSCDLSEFGGMDRAGVTANINKKEYYQQQDGSFLSNSDLNMPKKCQNLNVEGNVVALDESEVKILKFLFKHGYDFINKELRKMNKYTNSIAHDYVDILEEAASKTQMLEDKIFDNDLIMVTGDGQS